MRPANILTVKFALTVTWQFAIVVLWSVSSEHDLVESEHVGSVVCSRTNGSQRLLISVDPISFASHLRTARQGT